MIVLKLKRVDMASAAPAQDRPIWVNASAIEWFDHEPSSKRYSVMMMRNGERVAVREQPEEILALLADAAPVPT